MNQRRNSILDQSYDHPWLDGMINQANDVLNALIRLRKHQLATDYVPERHDVQVNKRVDVCHVKRSHSSMKNI
jgi:hypothetical protein